MRNASAEWLSLAAAPVFAAMALATTLNGGPADTLCAVSREASPLGGMGAMYAMMAVFHLGPWLKSVHRVHASLMSPRHSQRVLRERGANGR
ncbi:MAG: hypothetical protein ACXWN9_16290 [Candidatus Binataceae bacterium]